MNLKKINKKGGFTLIEILVVIGIIAILATIVLIAINPARQFAQTRDTQRISNVNTILNAIGQRIADNKGIFEGTYTTGSGATLITYTCSTLPASGAFITASSTTTTGGSTTAGDLGCLIPRYINAMPTDPKPATGSGYKVQELSTGRIQITAPDYEVATSIIEITR